MSNWDIGVVTDVGRAALAKVEAGTATAEFVSMAIGNGSYSTAEIATLVRATALKSQKLSSGFSARRFSAADTLALKASFSNETVDTDFYITECGIFMEVTEGGTTSTILFAISLTETPDVMSAYNGSYPQIVTNEYYLPISSESSITVEMSSVAYALAEDLDTHEAVHGNASTFGHVKVDSAFSATSENTIQNKVVTNGKADRTNIAPVEVSTTPATQDYAIGEQFYLDNVLYKAKTAITSGTAWSGLVLNTNYELADDVSSQIQALTNKVTKTVKASSTPGGTYGAQLAELSAAYALLTENEKRESFLRIKHETDYTYAHLVTGSSIGMYVYVSAGSTGLSGFAFKLSDATAYFCESNTTAEYTNVSSPVSFELLA